MANIDAVAISKAEAGLCESLRAALAGLRVGAEVPDSPARRDLCSAIEFYVPEELRRRCAAWAYESLDGVIPLAARKRGDVEIEIFGLCTLITDQALAPIHVKLQLTAAGNAVGWLQSRLGERGTEGMVRTPYAHLVKAMKRLHALDLRPARIDWLYRFGFGTRAS